MADLGLYDQVSYQDSAELYEAQVDSVQPHFRHFLPTPDLLNGEEVLIIDYAASGMSLLRSVQEIKKFYRKEFPGRSVTVQGLGLTSPPSGKALLKREGLDQIPIESELFALNLRQRAYQDYAEFERPLSFPPPQFYRPPKKRGPQFELLKEEYAKRLRDCSFELGIRAER
jgi:hypothetical protein